ncbi:MAG: cytosine permease [Candidatus Brocadiaceae bacterium]|nr:cytosine permease [Candidatus Brocadiaceae bacterium]
MLNKKILNTFVTEEYTHEPVPDGERKHWIQIAAVWMGFTMAASLAVLGGIVQNGVGVGRGMLAVLAGNLMLFVYSTLLGYISFKTGLNFPLVAKRAFGTKGYIIVSFILSALVLGWFAVQSDMFGHLLQATVLGSFPRWALTLPFALLFTITALLGYKAMVFLSYLVIPSFLAIGSFTAWKAFVSEGMVISMERPVGSNMGMGTAISIVAASFIVSATMTGDFVRWARSFRDVIVVHFLAFIVGLGATMMFGIFLSAAGKQTDIFSTLVVLGLAVPGAIMTGLNLWSTCDNCLYNSALGFTNQASSIMGKPVSEKKVVITLGIIGAILATYGAYKSYEGWLMFIGFVVPPVGGIIIADYYVAYRNIKKFRYLHNYQSLSGFKWYSFLAWIIGVGVSYFIQATYPFIPAAYVGVFVGGLVYAIATSIIDVEVNIISKLDVVTVESTDD